MRTYFFALTIVALLSACATDDTLDANAGSPSTQRGAWRGDTGLTGVGGTGTGGTGQAGAGISGIGVDRQRTTGTGGLTNRIDRPPE
jgi:hypothetical protein